MSGVPERVWKRWSSDEFDALRQVVVVFGGTTRKEAALELFPDVSLLYQEGEATNSVKGVFYLTSRRIVFLPDNMMPHPRMVHATFNYLKCLTGTRSDLTMSITERQGSIANFQFASEKALFQCFNTLRVLCEASRKDPATFRRKIVYVATRQQPDETPFSSIEVELAESDMSLEVLAEVPEAVVVPEATGALEKEEKESVASTSSLQYVRFLLDYLNHIHFDMHIKLRILFVISACSFFLKFIPFLPLFCIVTMIFLLYNAWERLDYDNRINPIPVEAGNESLVRLQTFWNDWFAWGNPKKSRIMLRATSTVAFCWFVLPPRVYLALCTVAYIIFIAIPVYRHGLLSNIANGFWFST